MWTKHFQSFRMAAIAAIHHTCEYLKPASFLDFQPSHASTSSFITSPTEINERGGELEILGAADRNFQTFHFIVHFASSTYNVMEVTKNT